MAAHDVPMEQKSEVPGSQPAAKVIPKPDSQQDEPNESQTDGNYTN